MGIKLETTLVGVAGEYLVAGELSLRGFLAAITLRNSRGVDIIASSADGSRSASIQVKTNSTGQSSWLLNNKSETYLDDNHYYVFVSLKEIGVRPDFYVVPSRAVAGYVKRTHEEWLSRPKRDGTPRRNSNMRKFSDREGKYREAWEHMRL